mmetsp:Transcript_5725/g.12086  ORF Transcript_5725/g.12086 Transcript_5725/m.12086 type:complete len:222 (-) Transcript_5725:2660-3325(-)
MPKSLFKNLDMHLDPEHISACSRPQSKSQSLLQKRKERPCFRLSWTSVSISFFKLMYFEDSGENEARFWQYALTLRPESTASERCAYNSLPASLLVKTSFQKIISLQTASETKFSPLSSSAHFCFSFSICRSTRSRTSIYCCVLTSGGFTLVSLTPSMSNANNSRAFLPHLLSKSKSPRPRPADAAVDLLSPCVVAPRKANRRATAEANRASPPISDTRKL